MQRSSDVQGALPLRLKLLFSTGDLAILFSWRCPISRERHRALRDELAARAE